MAIRNEALALRIVRHLIDLAAERKVAMATTGSSNIWEHGTITGELPPQVVLLVSGTDRLLMSTEGAASNLLGPLTTLINEAVGVRIQIVLAGLPRIVTNRLGMNIERRFVFQLADANERTSADAAADAVGVDDAASGNAVGVRPSSVWIRRSSSPNAAADSGRSAGRLPIVRVSNAANGQGRVFGTWEVARA